jgi:murein DD-endopeptidase MepM/ murein hydrolase activator NlpD
MGKVDNALRNHQNGSNFGEISGTLNKAWKSENISTNVDPNAIFVINDIELIIPPTQISVRKENLHWSWKTLRTNVSTKIPSGNAVNQINVSMIFTPDLILHLHRLIVQFKHSPFCNIQSKFIRHSICPEWPEWQEMAFTMNSLNVTNMPGYPGSFMVQLEMRWFNYFCYTPNFLYRHEYQTKPMKIGGSDTLETYVRRTIDTVSGPRLSKTKTDLIFEGRGNIDSYSLVKQQLTNKKVSLHDMVNTHAGAVFDLLPLPQNMERSIPVPCKYSNIYTRYINDLQLKALYENFDVDVFEIYLKMGESEKFSYLTRGQVMNLDENTYSGRGVFGLHTGKVPRKVSYEIAKGIFNSSEMFRVLFDEYVTLEKNSAVSHIDFELRKKISEDTLVVNERKFSDWASEQKYDVSATPEELNSIKAKVDNSINSFQPDGYLNSYQTQHPKGNYYIKKHRNSPGHMSHLPDINEGNELFFHPPVIDVPFCSSAFGMRKSPTKGIVMPHQGIDIITLGSDNPKNVGKSARTNSSGRRIGGATPVFAAESGIVISAPHESTILIEHDVKTPDGNTLYTRYMHGATRSQYEKQSMSTLASMYGLRFKIKDKKLSKGDKVNRGDIIMIMGNERGSAGVHVHFETWVVETGFVFGKEARKNLKAAPIDPYIVLNAKKDSVSTSIPDVNQPNDVSSSAHEETDNSGSEMVASTGLNSSPAAKSKDSKTKREERAISGNANNEAKSVVESYYSVSDYDEFMSSDDFEGFLNSYGEETKTLYKRHLEMQTALTLSGYIPYLEDYRSSNVYYRPQVLSFDNPEGNAFLSVMKESSPHRFSELMNSKGAEETLSRSKELRQSVLERKGIVVSAMGASMQHIVANIPLVGLEYPTHQHLGSIEPTYFIEMTALSDEIDNLKADGLDMEARLFIGAQSLLQSNAKVFRTVPDSHSLIIDSFITRLMGTYKEKDVQVDLESNHVKLFKRCIFTSMNVSTVPGSPGAHNIYVQFSETNPYSTTETIDGYVESKSQITEEDIKEAISRVDKMQLEPHGRIAMLLHGFGNLKSGNQLFQEENAGLTELNHIGLDDTIDDLTGKPQDFATFETVEQKILVGPSAKPVSQDEMNRLIEKYAKEWLEGSGFGNAVAGGVALAISAIAFYFRKKMIPALRVLETSPAVNSLMTGTARAAMPVTFLGGGVDAIGDSYESYSAENVPEEDLKQAMKFIERKLKDNGFELKDKIVMISNGPIDSEIIEELFPDNNMYQQLPDGRIAVMGHNLMDQVENHFDTYKNSEAGSGVRYFDGDGNAQTSESNLNKVGSKDDTRVDINVTEFLNNYPQYKSLTFKGEKIDSYLLQGTEGSTNGIANINNYYKAIKHIRELGPLMLAENEFGGLDDETITKETYGILVDEVDPNDPDRLNLINAASSMVTSFLNYTYHYFRELVSNQADGMYNEMSKSFGYSIVDVGNLFLNLNIENNNTGSYEYFWKHFQRNTNVLTNSKIQDSVRFSEQSFIGIDNAKNYASGILFNGLYADIGGGIGSIDIGEDDYAGILDVALAGSGQGVNGKINQLTLFYQAREQMILDYISYNLDRGAYGLTENVINNYLPGIGGFLNIFKKDNSSLREAGFLGFYGLFNNIAKYLFVPRSIGAIPAYQKYGLNKNLSEGEQNLQYFGMVADTIGATAVENTVSGFTGLFTPGAFLYGTVGTAAGSVNALQELSKDVVAANTESAIVQNYLKQKYDTTGTDYSEWIRAPYSSAKVFNDTIVNNAPNMNGNYLQFLSVDSNGIIQEKNKNILPFSKKAVMNTQTGFAETADYTLYGRNDARIRRNTPFSLAIREFVKEENERAKLDFIKKQLYIIGTNILMDSEIAFAIGMEDIYKRGIDEPEYKGMQCYPDIDLPKHPYYDVDFNYNISPDFYMWNIYEDGSGGLSKDIKDIAFKNVEAAVERSMNFFKNLEKGGLKTKNNFSLNVAGSSYQSVDMSRTIKMHVEGSANPTIVSPKGEYIDGPPCIDAFRGGKIKENEDVINYYKAEGDKGIKVIEATITDLESKLESQDKSSSNYKKMTYRLENYKKKLNYIKNLSGYKSDYKTIGKLSNWDFDIQNLSETDSKTIQAYMGLRDKAVSIENMFGSSTGHTGNYISREGMESSDIWAEVSDTSVAALDSFSHQFDMDSVKKLAKDSVYDILTEKYRMKRAYPTFKLFFIEEDEYESRFINYDDFYSFNAVKEFTIHRSRKLAGDTATIVLQNVSGTLDGTKRNVYRDIDYFSKKKRNEIKRDLEDVEVLADNYQQNSAKDQPFGSIVMRPGVNVQLRVGYSNDPNMLEVMISGRVTEVSWGKAADVCEITIQSFGTELTQYIKNSPKTFYSTHQLLGAMMLSPELRHFGRWEFGQLFQDRENQDSTVDFYDYSQNSELNNWSIVNWAGDFFSNNFGKLFVGAAGVIAVSIAIRAGKFGAIDDISKAGEVILKGGSATVNATSKSGALASAFGRLLQATFVPAALRGGQAISSTARAPVEAMIKLLKRSGAINRAGFTGAARALTPVFSRDVRIASGLGPAFGQISKALRTGQPITNAMRLNYFNALNRAVNIQRVSSHYVGLPRLLAHGPLSAKGLGGLGQMSWRLMWDTLGSIFTAQILIGAFAFGLNKMRNQSRQSDFMSLKAIKRYHAKQIAKIKVSPADDNLYPPNPMSYMRLNFMDPERDSWSGFAMDSLFAISDYLDISPAIASMIPVKTNLDPNYPGALREIYNHWSNSKSYILNKRLTVDQTEYFVENVRIWDVFHEMSLRHPGWIYGTMPYGKEFRYTMFFGVPSQRYWSKPAKPYFVTRMNTLRGYLINEQQSLVEVKSAWIETYGKDSWEKSYNRSLDKNAEIVAYENVMLSSGPELRKSAKTKFYSNSNLKASDPYYKNRTDMALELQVELRTKLVREYLVGLENRFVPFRRYHYLTSEEDIVANNIMSSEHNVANAVNVVYYSPEGDTPFSSLKMKASSSIPDNKINMANVDHGKNVRGYTMALRYGVGSLTYGMKEIYRGELLVLGNPRIKPWDICVLFDRYNSMSGPVEVEAVTHLFSHETGFLTEIVPNGVVISNELSTYPVLDALKIMIGAVSSLKDGKNFNFQVDKIPGQDGDYSVEIPGLNPAWVEELDEKMRIFNDSNLNLTKVIGENGNMNQAIFRSNMGPSVATTVNTGINNILNLGATGYGSYYGVGAGMGLGTAGVFLSHMVGNTNWVRNASLGSGLSKGIYELSKNVVGSGAKNLATLKGGGLLFGGAALVGAVGGGLYGYSLASDPNRLWLTAAPLVLSKLTENDAVILVPLLKENRPMVSGISFKDPMSSWRSMFSNIYNETLDHVIGANDYITESMRYGDTFWSQYSTAANYSDDFRNSLAAMYYKGKTYYEAFFERE